MTRAKKLASKDTVPAPGMSQDSKPLTREDMEAIMNQVIKKMELSMEDMVQKTVYRMAATISQQLSSDLRAALRNMSDELDNFAHRLKTCEERLNEKPAVQPASPTQPRHSTTFEIDRLEQYSRRENVRIRGIPFTEGEDTDKIAVDLAKECGVEMTKSDISTSHRLQSKKSPAPIVVRLVRREKKVELMKAKRIPKAKRDKVYIDEDLTPLRAKMFHAMRNDPSVSAVWTIDGRLHCRVTLDGKELKTVVDTPEDLFHLGWSQDKLKPFYA